MQDFKKPNKKTQSKKSKRLYAMPICKRLLYERQIMKAKKTEEQRILDYLKGLSFDQLAIVTAKAESTKKAKAKGMSEKEKLERLSGHDEKIESLKKELSIYVGLRRSLAKELGMIEIVKASRSGISIWNLEFTRKGKKAKALNLLCTKAGSTIKPFTWSIPIGKIGKHDYILKADRKTAFEKLAIHYGIDPLAKAYNNISTNNWLKAMVEKCSPLQIAIEGKHNQS